MSDEKCKPTWLPYGLRIGGCLEFDPGTIVPAFPAEIVQVSENYTMTGVEDIILCTGFVEVTMISVADATRSFIVNASGDSVIMNPAPEDTIETAVIIDGNSAHFAPKKSTSEWLDLYNPSNSEMDGFIGIGIVGSGELYTRDGFFSYKDNKSFLKVGLPIRVNVDGVIYNYVWNDSREPPPEYDPTKWIEASICVPPGTVDIGTISLKEGGHNLLVESELSETKALVIDREFTDELGSLDPITPKLGPLQVLSEFNYTGLEFVITNGLQFGGESVGIDSYSNSIEFLVKTDLVNFHMISRLGSHEGGTAVSSEIVNHVVVDTDNGDKVRVKFNNLAESNESRSYFTTFYLDQDAVFVGGTGPDGALDGSILYASDDPALYNVLYGYPVVSRQNLLNGSLDTPDEIRDKLQTLEGDERLDYSAIKNNNALITHYTSENINVPASWNGDILTVLNAEDDITVTLPGVDSLLNSWSLLIVNAAESQTKKVTVLAGSGTSIINNDDCIIPSQASIRLVLDAARNTIYPLHFEGFPKYITVNAGGGNLLTSWSIEGYIDFDANYSQIYAVKMSFTLSAVVADITTEIRLVGTGDSANKIYFLGTKTSNLNGYHEIDLSNLIPLPNEFMTLELQAKRKPVWGQSSVGKMTIIYGDKP